MTQQADPLSVLGKSGPNLDAYERVTGLAKNTGDLELPGMLVARVLRSPHAHARIVSIDTSRAEALQGVKAVVTHKDAPKVMVWGSRQYLSTIASASPARLWLLWLPSTAQPPKRRWASFRCSTTCSRS